MWVQFELKVKLTPKRAETTLKQTSKGRTIGKVMGGGEGNF